MSIWKRILAGLGVILVLTDPVGAIEWQIQAADGMAEYTETEAFETEIVETENQESEENDMDIQEQESEYVAEQIMDGLEEEEQLLDGQEEQITSEQLTEQNDFQLGILKDEVLDESAEAGNATDGGFLTGRGVRRVRIAMQFQNSYGDQLSAGEREVYEAMEKAWSGGGTGSFTVEFQKPLTFQATGTEVDGVWKWAAADATTTEERIALDPAIEEPIEKLRCYIQGGFDACIYDHPEIFWLKRLSYGYKNGIKWETQTDGKVIGKITSVTISGIESWTDAKKCVSEFQGKVDDAVETIQKSFVDGMTDAQKMKQIHDYICAKCVYQEGTYAHSAYGTFFDGKVVCEGYAKAFKILCNRMGLTCVLGSGTVHKTSSDGAHMWNYVLLDGGWYMVDATWDDRSTLSNRYLFAGAQTEGFYYPIAQERTNYTIFSKEPYGHKFIQPALQEDTYHEKEETGYIPASCESNGLQTWQCQLCDEITQEPIPAMGHSFEAWKITTEASCEQSGVKSRICQNCQKTETESIPATGHSYGTWQISRAATALEEGKMSRSCQNAGCASVQTKVIGKLPGFVRFNVSSITLQIKQSTTGLKVTDMAEGDRIISWKSSKPKVATVSKTGKITAKKVGTSIITVTLASGATANVKVKVQKKAVQPVSLHIACSRLKSDRITLKKGQSTTCKATVRPFTCRTKATFSSANPKIVKVSGNGKIIARNVGKTKITVKAGKKKKVVWVTVKK